MELSTTELHELAALLSRRMTPALEPIDPMDPPRPGDPAIAWMSKLDVAQRNGSLPVLAHRIAAVDPDDDTLQAACDLLSGESSYESYAAAAVIAGGALVTLMAATAATAFVVIAEITTAATAPVPIPTPLEPIHLARAGASMDDLQPQDVVPTGRCTSSEGGLVGYWYAGPALPGRAGEVVDVAAYVNVREAYPSLDNGFNTQSGVSCVLEPGDRVRLSQDPILVPRRHYWVPLVTGDLVEDEAGPAAWRRIVGT